MGGLARDHIVKPHDAPMLIIGGKGWVNVAIYDHETGRHVDYGSIPVDDLTSMTVMHYDWDFD